MALSVISVVIATLSAFASYSTYIHNVRKDDRDGVWQYLEWLLSPDTMHTRDRVGIAAREDPDTINDPLKLQEKTSEYRDAIFRLMSIVQAAGPIVNRHVKRKNTATPEAILVYNHLNLIIPDLRNALINWGAKFDLWDSAKNTNLTLDTLKPVKNGFEITQATVTQVRLPGPEEKVLPKLGADTPDAPPGK